MFQTATDHYEVLEVDRGASQTDIRAAYFRLIKEHTPEGDPEGFRLISEAYRVLSSAERRQAYDTEEQVPPEVAARIQELIELAGRFPDRALVELEQLADTHRHLQSVRFAHGVLLDRLERHGDAVGVFRALYEDHPQRAVYALWLGDALVQSGLHARGVEYLEHAIALDPNDPQSYFCLARHYANTGRTRDALAVLQRGIEADGTVDIQDLPLFIQRLFIFAHLQNSDEFRRAAREIVQLTPDGDADARHYIASQLWPLVQMFGEANRPDLATVITDAIAQLDPADTELKAVADNVRTVARLHQERDQALGDGRVPQWLKAFVYALSNPELSEDQQDNILTNAAVQAATSGMHIPRAWGDLVERYPALGGELQQSWWNFEQVTRRISAPGHTTSYSPAASDDSSVSIGSIIVSIISMAVVFFLVRSCGG